jgi:hypothetical protein
MTLLDARGVGAACSAARLDRTNSFTPVEIPIKRESLLNPQFHEQIVQVDVIRLFFEAESFAVVNELGKCVWTAAAQDTWGNCHLPL